MSFAKQLLPQSLYDYYSQVGFRENEILKALRLETAQLAVANMQINPEQGQFLHLITQLLNVEKALEIGTFTGYSSICIANALAPHGQLIACDHHKEWTAIAKKYWQKAGVEKKIHLHLAKAALTLEMLLQQKNDDIDSWQPFDLAFIDANKKDYDLYYEYCLQLIKPNGTMIIDNMLQTGKGLVHDGAKSSPIIQVINQLNQKIHQDKRVNMCLLPIGSGMMLVRKNDGF